jgi:hypothetical protein
VFGNFPDRFDPGVYPPNQIPEAKSLQQRSEPCLNLDVHDGPDRGLRSWQVSSSSTLNRKEVIRTQAQAIVRAALAHQSSGLSAGFPQHKLLATQANTISVDFTSRWNVDPKSGDEKLERQTPIPQSVMNLLRDYVGDRKSGSVFRTANGRAIGLRDASRLMAGILKRAGIHRPGLGWHGFRR